MNFFSQFKIVNSRFHQSVIMEDQTQKHKLQALKKKLIKTTNRSSNLQLIQKNQELLKQQEYIKELKEEIVRQNSRINQLEIDNVKLRRSLNQRNDIILKNTEKIMKKFVKSMDKYDAE